MGIKSKIKEEIHKKKERKEREWHYDGLGQLLWLSEAKKRAKILMKKGNDVLIIHDPTFRPLLKRHQKPFYYLRVRKALGTPTIKIRLGGKG